MIRYMFTKDGRAIAPCAHSEMCPARCGLLSVVERKRFVERKRDSSKND